MSIDTLLVVNAGSSSLKFHVYALDHEQVEGLRFWFGGQVSGIGTSRAVLKVKDSDGKELINQKLSEEEAGNLRQAQDLLATWLATQLDKAPVAVGHRIVHGGVKLTGSRVIDEDVLWYLDSLAPLAPLHQHNNLAPVSVIKERWPDMLQVACVDTAFHCCQSTMVNHYALPEKYYEQGVRRYGFHGLSYQYISEYLAENMPRLHQGRVLVAHLGSGASATMVVGGLSRESTMGFTALDGLPMATRPGRLDAGVVLWWMQQQDMTAAQIQNLLYNESGLKGISGISGDMRELLASDAPSAKLAVDYYAYRVAESLAGLCVSAQGVDALVFTAGVGEHSPEIRARIVAHLGWLGLELDAEANDANQPLISTPHSKVEIRVIPTNEELVIARETLRHYRAQEKA